MIMQQGICPDFNLRYSLGIYVAVMALINLNERFIDAVSNPAGIIGLFLVCLLYLVFYFVFIYRRLRKKTVAFEQAVSGAGSEGAGF